MRLHAPTVGHGDARDRNRASSLFRATMNLAPSLLLFVTLTSAQARNSSPPAPAPPKDARPRASLTVESEEPDQAATPPYPSGMEKLAIRDRIVDSSPPIRECYEKRLAERPTLQGKLVARVDNGPEGQVIGAGADGIADRQMVVC